MSSVSTPASFRWDYVPDNADEILRLTVEHLEIVVAAVAITVILTVPLAVVLKGHELPYQAALTLSGVGYTIPSLALLAILVPFVGIGAEPVIISLVVYSVLTILQNTVVGLRGVPQASLDAARGMGMTNFQIVTRVELPLALPSIMTGVRLATVTAVGIATIGVLVAGGGLGELIFTKGIQRGNDLTPIVVGALAATLLAIALDLLLQLAEWFAKPWVRRAKAAA